MELLDRYLQAVKFWLPRKLKHDILSELSEDIRSEIEDKEAELHRPLGQAELETISPGGVTRCWWPSAISRSDR